jgi:CRISPR-associated protein Cst2
MPSETLAHQIRAAAALGGGRSITGLSIAARASLSAHALNNEGTRNNAQIARQVNVVSGDDVEQTNAVSGDVLKHGFVDNLRALALAAGDAVLPLCEPCKRGDPNRINEDSKFKQALTGIPKTDNASVVDEMVRRCVIDDLGGLLVTQGNRNAPRRSVIQFGWLLGVPDRVRTGNYTHVKLVSGAAEEDAEGSNRGQNLFTRPASSGQYAFVTQLALHRIGYNDVTAKAVPDVQSRGVRKQAALEALYLTLAAPSGAQRNTQLPHLQGAHGAVCVSFGPVPPVLYSPLEEDFTQHMDEIGAAFGRLGRDLAILRFSTVGELGEILHAATAWVGQ